MTRPGIEPQSPWPLGEHSNYYANKYIISKRLTNDFRFYYIYCHRIDLAVPADYRLKMKKAKG